MNKYRAAMRTYDVTLMEYQKSVKAWRDGKLSQPPIKPEPPVPQRLLCSDATVASLVNILEHNRRGLLLARDELDGWLGSFNGGSNSHRMDRSHWLQLHRAGSLILDRQIGSGRTICINHAAVSITGGIQPAVFQQALATKHFEDGLAARLLVAMPPRRPRRWSDREVDGHIIKSVGAVFDQLYGLSPQVDEHDEPRPVDLPFTGEAKERWIKFFNGHAQEMASQDRDLAAVWAKLEGYTARFALIIHLSRWAAGESGLSNTGSIDQLRWPRTGGLASG